MNHPIRVWLFRHYWWIALLVLVTGSTITLVSQSDNHVGTIATIFAGLAGVVFFIQKQKIEELKLFEDLFTRFNGRYSTLNAGLQALVLNDPAPPGNPNLLADYFNLCAEEYLFYQRGLILREVWRAWCRGMMEYLDNAAINAYWVDQQPLDSHYGLTREAIVRGRDMPVHPTFRQAIQCLWRGDY